jgi:hypothetical protein
MTFITHHFRAEYNLLKENMEKSSSSVLDKDSESLTKEPTVPPLFSRPILIPFFISTGLMFFQQWSGVNAIIFYTVMIFDEASKGGEQVIDENLATIVIGIIQFLATFCKLEKRFNKDFSLLQP